MAFSLKSASRALLLLGLLATNRCTALNQTYCSPQNTGSNYPLFNDIYQSNGLCHDHCVGQYAFAIVQYQNCWCSNYIPAEQSSVANDCTQHCPGFPDEHCGNQDAGLYGYIALTIAPSGTSSGAVAPTNSPTASPNKVNPPASSDPETTTSSRVPTPTLVTNTQVVTISGAVVTQTVTSTPIPQVSSGGVQADPQPKSSGNNTAAIVGGVVGGLAALILVAAILFFLWRRRDNQRKASARRLDRNASVLSKAGLLTGRNKDPEKSLDEPNYGGQRHSAPDNDAENGPISSPAATYDRTGSLGRRNSRPLFYDQRLNPAALMHNWEHNGSRASVNTMQDQHDYSRPLGVTNPDLHDDD